MPNITPPPTLTIATCRAVGTAIAATWATLAGFISGTIVPIASVARVIFGSVMNKHETPPPNLTGHRVSAPPIIGPQDAAKPALEPAAPIITPQDAAKPALEPAAPIMTPSAWFASRCQERVASGTLTEAQSAAMIQFAAGIITRANPEIAPGPIYVKILQIPGERLEVVSEDILNAIDESTNLERITNAIDDALAFLPPEESPIPKEVEEWPFQANQKPAISAHACPLITPEMTRDDRHKIYEAFQRIPADQIESVAKGALMLMTEDTDAESRAQIIARVFSVPADEREAFIHYAASLMEDKPDVFDRATILESLTKAYQKGVLEYAKVLIKPQTPAGAIHDIVENLEDLIKLMRYWDNPTPFKTTTIL